jgi:hypothetical protein
VSAARAPLGGGVGIVGEIVRVILPAYPALDARTRAAVEMYVAHYVAAQVGAMPAFLRAPYRAALLGFDWLPLLRYGRRFRSLPAAARAAYLAWWDHAPVSAMRDVIKVIRSTALLVYFDNPSVLERLEAERAATGRAGD